MKLDDENDNRPEAPSGWWLLPMLIGGICLWVAIVVAVFGVVSTAGDDVPGEVAQ